MREIVVHLVLAQFVQGSLKVPWGKEQHTNLQQKPKKKKINMKPIIIQICSSDNYMTVSMQTSEDTIKKTF